LAGDFLPILIALVHLHYKIELLRGINFSRASLQDVLLQFFGSVHAGQLTGRLLIDDEEQTHAQRTLKNAPDLKGHFFRGLAVWAIAHDVQ